MRQKKWWLLPHRPPKIFFCRQIFFLALTFLNLFLRLHLPGEEVLYLHENTSALSGHSVAVPNIHQNILKLQNIKNKMSLKNYLKDKGLLIYDVMTKLTTDVFFMNKTNRKTSSMLINACLAMFSMRQDMTPSFPALGSQAAATTSTHASSNTGSAVQSSSD